MRIFTAILIAVRALARNRTRTALTMLGITVGIGAVLCTVALGQGTAAQVHNDLLNLGDNFVWLENGNRNVGGQRAGAPRLTADDMDAIVREVPEIVRCTPQVDARAQMIRGSQNWNSTYRGVTSEYLQIRRWTVVAGTNLTDGDVQNREKVAVLGQTIVERLFGEDEPIGETIRVGSQLFKVIGVLQPKGASTTGQNQDDFILIPYTTALRRLKGGLTLDDIMCSASSDALIPMAQEHIKTLIRDRHRIGEGQNDDFNIQTPDEAIRMREDTANTLGSMLAGIAAVSLLVGGIGIMNIMLVSVAERTREIGLRMAIGAREMDVQFQFLAEAVVLGIVGGAAGVGLGLGAAHMLEQSYGYPLMISPRTIAISVAVASATGLVFGFFPARHAAKLDPIEALRSE